MRKMKFTTRLKMAWKVLRGKPLRKPRLVATNTIEGA
jgi:hypothetical protein